MKNIDYPWDCRDYKGPALAVDAILEEDGKILLIKRKNEPFGGYWAIPGGFVEWGESVEEAVIRELEEETGIKAEIMELQGIYSKPGRDPRGHVVSIFFLCRGKGKPRPGDDASHARYFDIDSLRDLKLAFDHDEIIKEYIMRRKNVL